MTPVEILAECLADYQGQGEQFRSERLAEPARLARAAQALGDPVTGGFYRGYTEQATVIIAALEARGLTVARTFQAWQRTPEGGAPSSPIRAPTEQPRQFLSEDEYWRARQEIAKL